MLQRLTVTTQRLLRLNRYWRYLTPQLDDSPKKRDLKNVGVWQGVAFGIAVLPTLSSSNDKGFTSCDCDQQNVNYVAKRVSPYATSQNAAQSSELHSFSYSRQRYHGLHSNPTLSRILVSHQSLLSTGGNCAGVVSDR